MRRTLIEKILAKYSPSAPRQGEFCLVSPHRVMTHDNTGAVIPKYKSISSKPVFNSNQIVFTLDHDVQNTSEATKTKFKKIKEFASTNGIKDAYEAGSGIGHQIMIEQGYAFPFTMTVASDSHSNMYGGIGALGTPIVRTDAAAIWATGKTWWQVPPIVQVELIGSLPSYATGKDVIITLCGLVNADQVLNCAIEFTGPGVASLSIDDRLCISNMTTEWGALAGVFPVDKRTIQWLRQQAQKYPQHPRLNEETIDSLESNILSADKDAHYYRKITLDLSQVSPSISGPNSVKIAKPLSEIQKEKVSINKAYLLSCTNSRASDIAAAAKVLKGKKVHPKVEFYLAPASKSVREEAQKNGDWQELLNAGAIPLPAGCGPCIGLGAGLLKEGEVGISATNRNYKGRMGSPLATTYLASPEVVASSALNGYICGPFAQEYPTPAIQIQDNQLLEIEPTVTEPVKEFPSILNGSLIFCDQDNLNTDGIYPGKYTYQDDMTPQQMAQVVMENYDVDFAQKVQKGDILIGGFNFGTGSSREQAATCILFAGVKLVIAGSFSQTFKRNAINNGLLVLECPELVRDLRKQHERIPTRRLSNANIQLIDGKLTFNGKKYTLPPVGQVAQELVVEGGLENWVRNRI